MSDEGRGGEVPTGGAAVTGPGGFFGRALQRLYARRGKLRGLFRAPSARSKDWEAEGHQVVFGDLEDEAALSELTRDVDVVYHMAARRGKDDLAASRQVNVGGTERLLRAARSSGAVRVVYVSSISVYSATDVSDATVTEDVKPGNVERLNPYSRSKYEGELAVQRFAEAEGGPDYTIVRPTNVYGPWARSWFLDWVRRLKRAPLIIGGDAVVDLVHVDDVVSALVLMAQSPAAIGETLHVGHGPVRIADFAERVARVVGRRVYSLPSGLDLLARVAMDRGHRLLHRSYRSTPLTRVRSYPHGKARRLCGYAPRVSLDQGFAELALWYAEEFGRVASPPA